MDANGMPLEGFAFSAMPLGFGIALSEDNRAMSSYAELSEAEKEKIIMRCKDAKTKDEMQEIVDSLVPDGNVNSLFEGPSAK
ncbi:hypothetical protein LJC58_00565 [Lachnospiraceae bacterium OttesenSCG-928-D06]|nr:hypothetical protein [Lachnospiraceae bacterium OttesenSCG-928-D06]